ncbi:MAG: hypothetical protein ACP6IU_05175 [Candidatus Asgardarchaeia archaeon]
MDEYSILISLFIVLLLVSFSVFIILHLLKLKHILEIEYQEELNKTKYMRQPILAASNIIFIICLTVLVFAILSPQMPYRVLIRDSSIEVLYITEYNLIYDILPVVTIITLYSGIYPIIKYPKKLVDWLMFGIGGMLGIGSAMASVMLYYFGIIFFIFLLVFLVFLSGYTKSVSGFIFGFLILFIFIWSTHEVKLFLLLSVMLIIGVALGSIIALKFDPGLLFIFIFGCIPTLYSFILSYGLIFALTFLFGLLISIVYIFVQRIEIKIAAAVMLAIIYYFMNSLVCDFSIGFVFIASVGLGLMFIAELHKNSIKAILTKWILLSIKAEGNKIDLIKHKWFSDFKKNKIKKESYFFTWLERLILKPVECTGFSIEVIEEKDKSGQKFIKKILISTMQN